MSEPQRFAVVSLGSIGRRHLANLRYLRPDASIGVCRLSRKSSETDLPEHADVVFRSIDEVIQFRPSAAIIASPASTHGPVATSLARAGVHLLIEKPLTNSTQSAADLCRVIGSTGVVAMVGYNLRLMPGLRAAKDMVENGDIGRVISVRAEVGQYLPDWRPGQDCRKTVSAQAELGGGALLELSHEFDYLTWMFGLPDRVVAHGGNCGPLGMDVEDLVEVLMQYEAPKKLISVHLDFLDRAGFRQLRIIGESGTLCWNGVDDCVSRFDLSSRQWVSTAVQQPADRNQMYVLELRQFLDCVDAGCAPEVDVRQGCDVLRIVDAARRSMLTGESVEVEELDY